MRTVKQISCLAITLLMVIFMAFPMTDTFAEEKTGSITYSYPVEGATFRLYKVGKIENDVFSLTGDYKDYPVELSSDDNEVNAAAAETLAGYVERDQLSPVATKSVSAGTVVFDSLPQAIYLMIGETVREGDTIYTPEAILFSVPQTDENDNLVWDFTASAKYDQTDVEKTSVSVEKIWKNDSESSRPTEITVQLIKDDQVAEEVTLSKSNSWKHEWKNLDADHTYRVVEKSTVKNYTVKVEHSKTTYMITNTYNKPNTPSTTATKHSGKSSKIPQTGQLWWPVGILCVGGIAFILIGLIRRRRAE